MVLSNTVPIPNFASAIPIPSSQTSSSTPGSNSSSGPNSSSRKSKENQNGIFNPPRRKFNIPIATADPDVHEEIRRITIQRNHYMKNAANTASNASNKSSKKLSKYLDTATKKRLQANIKALTKEKVEVKLKLKQAEQSESKAQSMLLQAIRDRDQELVHLKHSPTKSSKDDEGIEVMKKEREELLARIQRLEEGLKETEETWTKRYIEKKQQLEKEAEERKRKASEQMEEQQRKKQKTEVSNEMTETQQLEKELKVC